MCTGDDSKTIPISKMPGLEKAQAFVNASNLARSKPDNKAQRCWNKVTCVCVSVSAVGLAEQAVNIDYLQNTWREPLPLSWAPL